MRGFGNAKKERSEMMKNDLRIMVIGAHPDDPEVNMAGTIAKFAESRARVRICLSHCFCSTAGSTTGRLRSI